MTAKVLETKAKTNVTMMNLKIWGIKRQYQQREKAAYGMGENVCALCFLMRSPARFRHKRGHRRGAGKVYYTHRS